MNKCQIPKMIYGGVIVDCYIGKVVKIHHRAEPYSTFCELEVVKELLPGHQDRWHYPYLTQSPFTTIEWKDSYEESRELYTPAYRQLIQVLRVGQGYGCSDYINLLETIEDAVPVPRYYSDYVKAVDSRTDNYQI